MTDTAKLSLAKAKPETAELRARSILENAQKGMGIIPNMYANMANSPGALETYISGYKLFRAESGFSPAEQEVVFLTISRENGCDYCMAAHSMIAEKMSGVAAPVLAALRAGEQLPDGRLQALSVFSRIMVVKRGKPTQTDLQAFIAGGFSERQVLEIILAIAVKTISNYANHVFHTDIDKMFSAHRVATTRAA